MRNFYTYSPLFLLSSLLLSGGCFTPKGLLYTRIREPLSLPSERIECRKADKNCYVSLTQLKEPVTHLNLSVMWSNKVVQDAAESAGISEIYYADIETISIFLDSYKRRRIYFYGN